MMTLKKALQIIEEITTKNMLVARGCRIISIRTYENEQTTLTITSIHGLNTITSEMMRDINAIKDKYSILAEIINENPNEGMKIRLH